MPDDNPRTWILARRDRAFAPKLGRKINRRRPRYIRGSAGKTLRVGRVGPGGEYAGIHAGVKLRSPKRRAEYYVGISAGRRIATHY